MTATGYTKDSGKTLDFLRSCVIDRPCRGQLLCLKWARSTLYQISKKSGSELDLLGGALVIIAEMSRRIAFKKNNQLKAYVYSAPMLFIHPTTL